MVIGKASTMSIALLLAGSVTGGVALAAPAYEPTRQELEATLEDLAAWLPGAWDSFPQIYHERTVAAPKAGEHEHWHRTFARIDAPQIGTHVFYGQINVGGRSGPMMPRSQVIYNARIDEARGLISITGQPPANSDRFVDLQDHPELWGEVRQRDPDAVHCDFIWRREGAQLMGTLEGKKEEYRKYGPGTCTFQTGSNRDLEFYADAEWLLSPDLLWLYDINKMAGHTFVGRDDRTHIKLYRARPFGCRITDAQGARSVDAYDRGFVTDVSGDDGRKLEMLLLQAQYPAANGVGLEEELRLMLNEPDSLRAVATSKSAPDATKVELRAQGVEISCELAQRFPPLAAAAAAR